MHISKEIALRDLDLDLLSFGQLALDTKANTNFYVEYARCIFYNISWIEKNFPVLPSHSSPLPLASMCFQ